MSREKQNAEIYKSMCEELFNNLEKQYQEVFKVKAESEQIEEMAKVLERVCDEIVCSDYHMNCELCQATRLYNAGYRKIPTTNWLTKGVSEEQLEREKEEALKEFFERNCEKYGYRKQSEGEWLLIKMPTGVELYGIREVQAYPKCSICGYMGDVSEWHFKYCPNCGAKMKGGAE